MLSLITLCGPPGSGKTTLSNKIAKEYGLIRYSFDELNCMYYDDLVQPALKTLEDGHSVVLDALYDRVKSRKKLLEDTSHINCKKILIVMITPLDECIRRNANRPNPLESFIVEIVHKSFEPPTLDEGWDEIHYY